MNIFVNKHSWIRNFYAKSRIHLDKDVLSSRKFNLLRNIERNSNHKILSNLFTKRLNSSGKPGFRATNEEVEYISKSNKRKAVILALSVVGYLLLTDITSVYRPLKGFYAIIKMVLCYAPYYCNPSLTDPVEAEEVLKECHDSSAKILYNFCLDLKGVYIKLGQALSHMNHVIPKEYVNVLTHLKKITAGRSLANANVTLKAELGADYRSNFSRVSAYSFASASMASVYACKLNDEKHTEVAVKVQYKEVAWYAENDLKFIIFALKCFEYFDKDLEFKFIFERLYSSLMDESNFVKEGQNSVKCAEDLKAFPYIYVPKVYWDVTTKKVIVTEFIDGTAITNSGLVNAGLDSKDVMKKIMSVFGYQIFFSGFVHGDPHHSNLIARKNQTGDGSAEIVVIDHGLYTTVEEKHKIAFAEFWVAGITGDVETMKKAASELGTDDYKTLWSMLFQRPYNVEGVSFIQKRSRTEMVAVSKNIVLRISKVLKAIPPSILLVLRNLNTLRALNLDLGQPCDFLYEMTKWAKKSLQVRETKKTFLGGLKSIFMNIYLTIMIWKEDLMKKTFDFFVGRSGFNEIMIDL